MIAPKHTDRLAVGLMAALVVLCLAAVLLAPKLFSGGSTVSMQYEDVLFNTDAPFRLDIEMDADEWQDMLDNALSEVYYPCTVTVGGETFRNVGIRPKGNTSLSTIARRSDCDRYSFKLEFDQYVDGQLCFGLDKLVLNNSLGDATDMKEAFAYDMFRFLGADASLYNYAEIYVNGEYWGVYLALEAVEESFMLRNYGVDYGYMYKPDFLGSGGTGSALNYSEASGELDNFTAVWNMAVNDSSTTDHERALAALKGIYAGEDLERYMDADNLLLYMAAHNFIVNDDSMSGSMAHNYYLYEQGGRLNMIPWDYNFAFGGHGSTTATRMVNDPIDDEWGATNFFDTLLANEEYLARYHEIYRHLIDDYILGGGFDEFYSRTRRNIDELVKNDPNALFTYEEHLHALDVFYDLVMLRAESVKRQLDGEIPSLTSERVGESSFEPWASREQTESDTAEADYELVDASAYSVSDMGRMSMGGGGRASREPEQSETESADTAESSAEAAEVSAEPEASGEADSASGEQSSERRSRMPMPGGFSGEPSGEMRRVSSGTVWLIVASCAVFAAALFLVIRFKRHNV